MVATWSASVTPLAVSPETLADAHDRLRGLAVMWEVLVWIVVLP